MDQAVTRAAGATPSTTPPAAAARRSWSILLTSANHGTVGPLGSTFPHAGEHHERVVVVEVPAAAGAPSDEVNLVLRAARENFAGAIEREVAAQAGQVAVPEGFAFMPKRLTAENGAKGLLSGEFAESCSVVCPSCDGSGEVDDDIDCGECSGEGTVEQKVAVEWDTIKRIYDMAVEHLAAAPSAPAVAQQAPARYISINEDVEFQALLVDAMVAAKSENVTVHSERIKALTDFIGARLGAQASTAGERQEGGAA